jgi:uroporphyrinogen-III synthase
MSLHGLHVLNTRPAHQSAGLSEALRTAGALVDELPLIAISPRTIPAAQKRWLMDLDRYNGVFFVSANAVRLGLDAVADYWPQWPHQLPAYAVGRNTAQGLEATALSVRVPAQADSEGLLALPELQQLQGQRFLLLRGVGGRELLPQTLRERGAVVDIIALYHRELPVDAVTRWQTLAVPPQLVLLTSPDALRHWQQVAGPAALQPAWLVVSARMREQAEAAGARVITAAAADTASVVAALQHYWQHQAHC